MIAALTLTGCSTNINQVSKTIDHNSIVAKTYLESQGYKTISYEGNVDNYTLTRDKLVSIPYSMCWELQAEDPGKYIGKEISVYKFNVTNHPLDNWKSTSKYPENVVKSQGRTWVWVYIADNKIVGGHSYPVIDQIIVGSVWSLEGKTFEEVHNIPYKDWLAQWNSKYGN